MSLRKQALLLTLAATGAVLVVSGLVLEGCMLLAVAIEVYVLCAAYTAPLAAIDAPDDADEDGGGWDPPDAPPDPWPPMSPDARAADERAGALV